LTGLVLGFDAHAWGKFFFWTKRGLLQQTAAAIRVSLGRRAQRAAAAAELTRSADWLSAL